MRTMAAQMKVDPYTASVGAKGELQQAWFRIQDIPLNQRSIRTVAKVGGLVGKVLEIDEKTRFRHDYVRAKIACRDIKKVPRSAESALGMSIIDFHFEREEEEETGNRVLNSGMKISKADQQHPNKKLKFDSKTRKGNQGGDEDKSGGQRMSYGSDKSGGKMHAAELIMSAPPKFGQNRRQTNQKVSEDKDRVYLPKNLEEGASESETFSEKVRTLDGYGDFGQGCSKQGDEGESKQTWCAKDMIASDPTATMIGEKKHVSTRIL